MIQINLYYGYIKEYTIDANKHPDEQVEDLINVIKNCCIEPGCDITATYNFEGESRAKYCSTHAKNTMVTVTYKKCEDPQCKRTAYYKTHPCELPAFFLSNLAMKAHRFYKVKYNFSHFFNF